MEQPEESEVEEYLLMDDESQRLFAYWKVLYEEISLETFVKEYEVPEESAKRVKDWQSRSSASECLEHRKENGVRKVENDDKHGEASIKGGVDRVFAPVAICIQTYNSDAEQGKNLLQSLINLLYTHESDYKEMIHKIIYSLAEFCTYTLYLTHIILPPYTKLTIPLSDHTVEFHEGLINDFPHEADMSIAYLFALLPVDSVVSLWNLLLTDSSVIIYTSSSKAFFHIAKALLQLLFPLEWRHLVGIVPDFNLLSAMVPYLYCVLASTFGDKEKMLGAVGGLPYAIYFVEGNEEPIISEAKGRLVHPCGSRIRSELKYLCSTYEVRSDGTMPEKSEKLLEFARDVQMLFFNELAALLNAFISALQEKKSERIKNNSSVLDIYMRAQEDPKDENHKAFMQQFAKASAVEDYCAELKKNTQGNYARIEAMNSKGSLPSASPEEVTLKPTNTAIISKLLMMAEMMLYGESETGNRKSNASSMPMRRTSELVLKEEYEWIREIASMKTQTNFKVFPNNLLIDSIIDNSRCSLSTLKDRASLPFLEESKERVDKDNSSFRLYGPKGALAFLTKFMAFDSEEMDERISSELCNNLKKFDKTDQPIEEDKETDTLQENNSMLNVANAKSPQFELLQALLQRKFSKDAMRAVKSFMQAFGYVEEKGENPICFPVNLLKEHVSRLDLDDVRKLLANANELGAVIKDVYNMKVAKLTKNNAFTTEKRPILTNTMKEASDRLLRMNRPPSEDVKYLNSKEPCILNDNNPNVIVSCLLQDLIKLISPYKSKGTKAFLLAKRSDRFKHIKRQAAALAVTFTFIRRMTSCL